MEEWKDESSLKTLETRHCETQREGQRVGVKLSLTFDL